MVFLYSSLHIEKMRACSELAFVVKICFFPIPLLLPQSTVCAWTVTSKGAGFVMEFQSGPLTSQSLPSCGLSYQGHIPILDPRPWDLGLCWHLHLSCPVFLLVSQLLSASVCSPFSRECPSSTVTLGRHHSNVGDIFGQVQSS